jgi:hypothetical protein
MQEPSHVIVVKLSLMRVLFIFYFALKLYQKMRPPDRPYALQLCFMFSISNQKRNAFGSEGRHVKGN